MATKAVFIGVNKHVELCFRTRTNGATVDANALSRLITSGAADKESLYLEELEKLMDDPFARFQWARHAAILEVHAAVEEVVAAYQQGSGTEPDQVRAFEWMKKGAEDLQITSLYFDLALAYRDGLGTPRNIEKFWELMGKAAKLKDTEAMFVLAEAHTKMDLGQKSAERAAEWTIKGAAAADPAASIKLARRYQFGDGVQRDPNEFFKWATKAVDSARLMWEKAKNSVDGNDTGGWTYEDYPDALAALADAYLELGQLDEAEETSLLAADAAREAIEFAKKQGDSVNVGKSKSLPEIMLRRLQEFKTKTGGVNKRRHKKYLHWLLRIDESVWQVYFSEDGPNAIPPGLAQATFELAIAYQQGIGTTADVDKGNEYMARAAKAGHGEAAFRYAMSCFEQNQQLEFTEYLSMCERRPGTASIRW
ncbi:tetratricopeptide repeat protein [Roseateles oligotrophus]|uniref:Sel1 repeat family protein n=1 Tax=Roseateles oligotrophus TaxID=1769250 RepID=A0ABT2YLS2_9BURK|nr:hypothetical protein [Roseateles oligotrophus]MCV2371004.1 hypothetical protein [Roseateles oligotrophus]